MRLVFRADASGQLGSGHVMRLSAIAEEAIGRGIESIFVGHIQEVDWLQERIDRIGFSQTTIPENFHSRNEFDILVLDSYDIDLKEGFIQPAGWKKIVVIADDLTPEYLADLIIHPGLEDSWFKGDRSTFLSGPKYMPLRKNIRKIENRCRDVLKKIVVFGGGTDPFGFAEQMAKVLRDEPGFESVIFFSDTNKRIESLDPRYITNDFGPHLDSEIDSADLIFTTASTSSLEVLARGLPLGVSCATENQLGYFKSLDNLGIATVIGERITTGNWELDINAIRALISKPELRDKQVVRASGLVDLHGASRVLDAITDT